MKYCSHCGNELLEESVICPKCGCPVEGMGYDNKTKKTPSNHDVLGYLTIANVAVLALIMFLSTVFSIWVNYLSGFIMNIVGIVFILSLASLFVVNFLKGKKEGSAIGWLTCKLFALALALANCICWVAFVSQMF